ncbi:MAG: peptidylprolyl isomerase [Chlamydiota bacterium]
MDAKQPIVVIETNQGAIEVELFPSAAKKTCENFLGLVEKNYYTDVIFHRVIKDFMIQGGDPTGTGAGGNSLWDAPFGDEFSPSYRFTAPGILAMANRGPNTNGSQFFITTVATPWLDNRHTIFGRVVRGMDIVRKIEEVEVDRRTHRPFETQKILKAYVKKD